MSPAGAFRTPFCADRNPGRTTGKKVEFCFRGERGYSKFGTPSRGLSNPAPWIKPKSSVNAIGSACWSHFPVAGASLQATAHRSSRVKKVARAGLRMRVLNL